MEYPMPRGKKDLKRPNPFGFACGILAARNCAGNPESRNTIARTQAGLVWLEPTGYNGTWWNAQRCSSKTWKNIFRLR
jgi:hypothetical protein